MLNGLKGCPIQGYCQEASVAAPLNSRNLDYHRAWVRAYEGRSTAAMKTTIENNDHSDREAESDGMQKGNFEMNRDMGTDPFVSGNTTSAAVDAEGVSGEMSRALTLSSSILQAPKTGVSQEVRDFLRKPILVSSGSFQTTDTVTSFLYNVRVPESLFGYAYWFNKISGNMVIRGDITYVLQVNANRFQQGRYILAWLPTGGPSVNISSYAASKVATLPQRTSLPHVELDLSCDTQAALTIPTVTFSGWYAVTQQTLMPSSAGNVLLFPYSPLVSPTGGAAVAYSLYAYMDNVEFGLPVVPQSSMRAKTAVVRRKKMENAEQEDMNLGPVSAPFLKISQAAQILTGIPLISSYAGMASWAANVVSRTASAFGLSKVSNAQPFSLMQRFTVARMVNSDTPDGSTKLSVFSSAGVDDLPGFAGSDLDEMAITYIASIPAWVTTVNWPTSSVEGTVLFATQVTPRNMYATYTYGTNTVTAPTPMAFAATFFSQWRGGMKFIFKIVKTEFHSGRLLVAFSPANPILQYGMTTPNINDTTFLHRHIIDIRNGNEFSLTVPWACVNQYLSTSPLQVESATGGLYVYVLNPLVAPASVSSSVNILIEVAAAEDFELAVPRTITERPVALISPQSGRKNVCEITSATIGDMQEYMSIDPARLAIGERVMSFKSLLKRFNPLISSPGTATGNYGCLPFSIITDYITAANTLLSASATPDVYSVFGCAFALARGSMRLKYVQPPNDAHGANVYSVNLNNLNNISGLTANWKYLATNPYPINGNNSQWFDNNVSHAEVEFPMYHRFHAWPVADTMCTDVSVSLFQYGNYTAPRTYAVYNNSGVPTFLNVYRAVGDDFSFGMFVAPPTFTSWGNTPS